MPDPVRDRDSRTHETDIQPEARVQRGTEILRVCMLSFYFHPAYSGSAVQAHGLARQLMKRGLAPQIVSANLTHDAPRDELGGIPVWRLPLLRLSGFQIPSFAFSLAWHLFRRRRSIDIVHAHGAYPHSIAGLVSHIIGKKSILKITMANSDVAFERQGRLFGRFNRYLVKQFDRYVTTSDEAYTECLSQGLDPSRVFLIPNGVDTDVYHPAESSKEKQRQRKLLGLPDCPIVAFVGVLNERKNVDGILKIWRSLMHRNARAHLLLIGPEPKDSSGNPSEFCNRIRRFVDDEGLDASVSFLGQQADVAAHLRCSDVFLFPSRREGMPNVVLEAMATGLPCIVSRIGGSIDIVKHEYSGYVHDVDDEVGMARNLETLLGNPALLTFMGGNARQTALEKFSLMAITDRYEALYHDLTSALQRHRGSVKV